MFRYFRYFLWLVLFLFMPLLFCWTFVRAFMSSSSGFFHTWKEMQDKQIYFRKVFLSRNYSWSFGTITVWQCSREFATECKNVSNPAWLAQWSGITYDAVFNFHSTYWRVIAKVMSHFWWICERRITPAKLKPLCNLTYFLVLLFPALLYHSYPQSDPVILRKLFRFSIFLLSLGVLPNHNLQFQFKILVHIFNRHNIFSCVPFVKFLNCYFREI